MAHDVFISYSSKDKTVADAICASLEAENIRCWIAPRDVLPGTEWAAAIMGALDSCRVMVLVFSSSSNTSPQVNREVEHAFNKGLIVVPFRIEDVKPNDGLYYYISSVHWLDALTEPMNLHIDKLVVRVKSIVVVDSGSMQQVGTSRRRHKQLSGEDTLVMSHAERVQTDQAKKSGSRTVTAFRLTDIALEWTTLRRKGGLDTFETHVLALPSSSSSDLLTQRKLLDAFLSLPGELTFTLSASQVLLRIMSWPLELADDLDGVVWLQMDKISPVLVERVSYEVLDKREKDLVVFCAGLPDGNMDKPKQAFSAARLTPNRLDIDVLGWWENLRGRNDILIPGRVCHLWFDHDEAGTCVTFIISQGSLMQLSRGLGHVDSIDSLIREITLLTLTSDVEFGEASFQSVFVYSTGNIDKELLLRLKTLFGETVKVKLLPDLPPVTEGMARRAIRAKSAQLSWREKLTGQKPRHAPKTDGMLLNLAPPEFRRRLRW